MSHPQEILRTLDAAPLKRFSQNFLTSPHWAEKLASAVCAEPFTASAVWEIGPGLGAITAQLKTRAAHLPLRLFEIDRKLVQYLTLQYPGVEITAGDFLDVDLSEALPPDGTVALLSNLPYHLSSPIFFKLLEQRHRLLRLVLTFQKEFGDRLMAGPGGKNYGGLSVLAQLAYKMEPLGVVPAGAFFPAPDVASIAVRFTPLPPTELQWARVNAIVKAAFAHRRKKLGSNLTVLAAKERVKTSLESLGFPETVRAEELSPRQYLDLTKLLG